MDTNMRGAGGFAWRRAGRIAVNPVGVVIVFGPFMTSPFGDERVVHSRINHFGFVLFAEFLA